MSNIDLKGITVSLDGLKTELSGFDGYKPLIQGIPQVRIPSLNSNLLTGLTLYDKEKVSKTV